MGRRVLLLLLSTLFLPIIPMTFLVERGQQPPQERTEDVLGVRSLESKVRFADHSGVDPFCQQYGLSSPFVTSR